MKLKKISIIGVGFMGGSLALALKDSFPKIYLVGFARSKRSEIKLKRLSLVDEVTSDLKKLVSDSDLVVLAMPIFTIIDFLKKISLFLKPSAIVIDLGSTKRLIDKAAKKYLPENVQFVGCHPLCGSNKYGSQNADKDLYKNSICVITSNNKAANYVRKIWRKLGSAVYYLSPISHDKMLAYISHLPHIISYSLSYLLPGKYFPFVTGSFKTTIRLADTSPQLWQDIFFSNQSSIVHNIKQYISLLKIFSRSIQHKDSKLLLRIMRKSNRKRKNWQQ